MEHESLTLQDLVDAMGRLDRNQQILDEGLVKDHQLVKELVAAVGQIRQEQARLLTLIEGLTEFVKRHEAILRPEPVTVKRILN